MHGHVCTIERRKEGAMHKKWDWELIYQWVLTMYFLRFSARIYSLANHIFPPGMAVNVNLSVPDLTPPHSKSACIMVIYTATCCKNSPD
jgi:hypothetical protein